MRPDESRPQALSGVVTLLPGMYHLLQFEAFIPA
jgi:hypothetical protein